MRVRKVKISAELVDKERRPLQAEETPRAEVWQPENSGVFGEQLELEHRLQGCRSGLGSVGLVGGQKGG